METGNNISYMLLLLITDFLFSSSNSSCASISTMASVAPGNYNPQSAALNDALDRRIDKLLRDWHHNPDLLFAVHPLDGSFLVW